MIKNLLLQRTSVPMLSKALDVYALRQKAIASNIANVGTTRYQRKEVRFEEELQLRLDRRLQGSRSDERHLPLGRQRVDEVQPEIFEDDSGTLESGVNNVDIDAEIVEQVKNEIRFMYASRMLRGKFDGLRASIKGHYDR